MRVAALLIALAATAVAFSPHAALADCVHSLQSDGYCLTMYTGAQIGAGPTVSHDESKAFCESIGGHTSWFETDAQRTELYDFLTTGVTLTEGQATPGYYVPLGGRRYHPSKTFVWDSGFSNVNLQHSQSSPAGSSPAWHPGEPNNLGDATHQCVHFWATPYLLNDVTCLWGGFTYATCRTVTCPAACRGPCVDPDGDEACEPEDNCPAQYNPDQDDSDQDGVGDACDACVGDDATGDADGDGVCDSDDACPGFDDAADADGDSVPDGCDACSGHDDAIDSDGDGTPDGCDACPLDNPNDTDGDGVCDTDDACPGGDDSADVDFDGVPDACDDDNDNDGTVDAEDCHPTSGDGAAPDDVLFIPSLGVWVTKVCPDDSCACASGASVDGVCSVVVTLRSIEYYAVASQPEDFSCSA